MAIREKPHAAGTVAAGDISKRVSIEQVAVRGVNVKELVEKLIDAAGAEFTTYYYYTICACTSPGTRTTRRSAKTHASRIAPTSS